MVMVTKGTEAGKRGIGEAGRLKRRAPMATKFKA